MLALLHQLPRVGMVQLMEGGGCALWKRRLSSAEVSTALRPFFFLVHPDLFGKYPVAQEQNEKSLKTLNQYVETLTKEGSRPNPKEVTFYIKPRTQEDKEKQTLRSVKIRLKETSVRAAVVRILKHAGLPTGYVDQIPVAPSERPASSRDEAGVRWYPSTDEPQPAPGSGFSSTDIRQPFVTWLSNNIERARMRLADCEPIRLETERQQGEICYNLGLKDIVWSCGWDTHHRRGVVESFNLLASQHQDVRDLLRGRTVVFGKNSGVSIRGDIILYSGEVRNNWLNVIKNAPRSQLTLDFLPLYEKALSQALMGIKLVHIGEGEVSSVLVEEYRVRLRKLVTSVTDYRVRRQLPATWHPSMQEFKLSVESEASSLMISPGGVFIVPASTPGFLIVEFITEHMEQARQRMKEEVSLQQEEMRMMTQCINELGLIQLDRDDSITTAQMIHCCRLITRRAHQLRHLTHGNHMIVTRYYMVKSDGTICIPWDLTFGEEDDGSSGEDRPVGNLKQLSY